MHAREGLTISFPHLHNTDWVLVHASTHTHAGSCRHTRRLMYYTHAHTQRFVYTHTYRSSCTTHKHVWARPKHLQILSQALENTTKSTGRRGKAVSVFAVLAKLSKSIGPMIGRRSTHTNIYIEPFTNTHARTQAHTKTHMYAHAQTHTYVHAPAHTPA